MAPTAVASGIGSSSRVATAAPCAGSPSPPLPARARHGQQQKAGAYRLLGQSAIGWAGASPRMHRLQEASIARPARSPALVAPTSERHSALSMDMRQCPLFSSGDSSALASTRTRHRLGKGLLSAFYSIYASRLRPGWSLLEHRRATTDRQDVSRVVARSHLK